MCRCGREPCVCGRFRVVLSKDEQIQLLTAERDKLLALIRLHAPQLLQILRKQKEP